MMLSKCVLLLALACTLDESKGSKTGASSFELIILHHNDVHAHFEQISRTSGECPAGHRELGNCYGGYPRVASIVKKHRREAADGGPPVLYLNAGDTYAGTFWRSLYDWRFAADLINHLQPDAVCLGNHDVATNSSSSPFLQNINAPVLASNIVSMNSNKTNNIRKSIVFDVAGVKVGVVGYLHPPSKLSPQKNIQYIDEVTAVKREADRLKSEGVQIIIALGHSSLEKDTEIARKVENIDLVIGGYKNTYFWNGINEDEFDKQNEMKIVRQFSGKSILVLQSYTYAKYLGKTYLLFNANGEMVDYDNIPIPLDTEVPQDNYIIEIINSYSARIDLSKEIIGRTSVPLDGDSCGSEECNLGDLITDAMVHKYYVINSKGKENIDMPAAMIQSGHIVSSIATPSVINARDLLKILPVESIVVAVTMNGQVLKQVLEHSVSNYYFDYPSTQFLQYSGINVEYDMSKPSGSRVVFSSIRCSSCYDSEFNAIEDFIRYKILMPSALAQGKNGYSMLIGLPIEETNYDEVTSLREYIAQYSPVYPITDNRITLLNTEWLNNSTNTTISANTTITTPNTTITTSTITTLPTTTPTTSSQATTTSPITTTASSNTTTSTNATTPTTTTTSTNATTPTTTTSTNATTPTTTTITTTTTTTTASISSTTPGSASTVQSSFIILTLSSIYFVSYNL